MSDERGRDPTPLISTGRGGAGNLVRNLSKGPDEAIAGAERGRELRNASTERVSVSGMPSSRGSGSAADSPSA